MVGRDCIKHDWFILEVEECNVVFSKKKAEKGKVVDSDAISRRFFSPPQSFLTSRMGGEIRTLKFFPHFRSEN